MPSFSPVNSFIAKCTSNGVRFAEPSDRPHYDVLTSLPNRTLFLDRLGQDIKKSNRSGHALALLYIDLDQFKEVNDTLGHHVGDALLLDAARRITTCVRDSDTVARLGGDEFTVILPDLVDAVADSRIERVLDLGFVGEPERVDTRVLYALSGSGVIPVIAPVGIGEDGQTYNINADTAAGAVAGALNATRLLMLTDVPGVLDADKRLIPELSAEEARAGIASGMISGGMIPKVETCLQAVAQGARAAVILDGRVPHACLLELFTSAGPGTLIRAA